MLAAVTEQAVGRAWGRRSAGLLVGAAAGWTCGLLGPGAGLLRRRQSTASSTLQAQGCQRQGADRQGRPVPSGSLDRSPLAAARAAAAQVRRQAPPLDPSAALSVKNCTPRHLSTRPPVHAIVHADPVLAPPIRPLPRAPLPCAVCRAQIGLPLALRRRPRAWGGAIFGREWGVLLMQIFDVNRFVSAIPPPATPPRPALRPGHTCGTVICAAPQRLRGRVGRAQVIV